MINAIKAILGVLRLMKKLVLRLKTIFYNIWIIV